jgi:predicted nucleotidyltransferase
LRRMAHLAGVSAPVIAGWLGETDPAKVDAIISKLVQDGYLEPTNERGMGISIGEQPWWRNTIRGNALSLASAAPPLTRPVADRHVAALVDRARAMNESQEYLYWVESVAVFGSYLDSSVERLGDVDVAFQLSPRSEGEEFHERCRERSAKSGRNFSTYLDFLVWPQTEVLMRLKNRSRVISLHDAKTDDVVRTAALRTIYHR